MNSDAPRRPPWHLWVVGTTGLLFNSVGALDFFMAQTRNESYMGSYSAEQLEIVYGLPLWFVFFWGLAVWGGAVGALLLLLRKRFAVPVLLASLLAMVVTAIHNFISPHGLYATTGTGPGFVLIIFGLALGLWLYARYMRLQQVLNS